jgi:hypothetical protein
MARFTPSLIFFEIFNQQWCRAGPVGFLVTDSPIWIAQLSENFRERLAIVFLIQQ